MEKSSLRDTVRKFNAMHYPAMGLDEVTKRLKAIGNISKDPVLWDHFAATKKR